MKRQGAGRRTLLAVVLAASLMSGALAGCGLLPSGMGTEKGPADYGDVADAVTAAEPRVAAVRDLDRHLNGFAYALDLSLVTDSAEPFTAEELDAVVEAIWGALPWEPNTISITAGADTAQGHEIVDLRAAAAELEPLSVTNAGTGGVSLTGMDARYGEWTAPD